MCFVALKDINDLKYRETMGKRENFKKSYIYIFFFWLDCSQSSIFP